MRTNTYVQNQDIPNCVPGQMTPQARDDALRVLNMYRRYAGLDPVQAVSAPNEINAMACALMCKSNNVLKHVGKQKLFFLF